MSLSDETEWRLFATMLLMRRFEEAVQKFAEERKFSGHYHLCIGQEATGAAAMAALRDGDHITTTHRNHGHIIARGADPSRALAEILGRQTGLNHGHGGTFHLCEPTLGFLSTSGIVGGAISLAVGGGYACKQRGDGSVTLAFFGDGALQEGIAYEAMNIASLWKLPVVFICENNDAGAPPGEEHAASDLANVPRALEIKTQKIEGIDPAVVHAAVAEAVARCRAGQGPAFIEARTKRWPGNAQQFPRLVTGVTDLRMATGEAPIPSEHRDWYERHDPVLRLARSLGARDAERLRGIDRDVAARMTGAIRFALESPLPAPQAALEHVFA